MAATDYGDQVPKQNQEREAREVLVPLLRRRYRLLAMAVLAGTVSFGALHVLLDEPNLGPLLALKVLQAATLGITLWISQRAKRRETVVAAITFASVVVNGVTAASGVAIGNVHTNALLYVTAALATSSFLPWGPWAQAVSVISAAIASLAPLYGPAPVYHDFQYDLMALAVAFGISVYIARETERDTLAEIRAAETSRQLAESRAEMAGILGSSNVLLAQVELLEDGFRITEGNEAIARVFGRSADSLRGASGSELGFNPDEIAQWRSILQRCAVEGAVQVPEYRLALEHPARWYHVSFSSIRDDRAAPTRFTAAGVEITALKQATEDVRRLNLHLEDQVKLRTALLEAANKDLESFAYSVSHDLRTPLRTIEGFAALLADDHADRLSAEGLEQLDRIRAASRHMAQLIDDMLMLSRASRTEMTRGPVDLSALALDVIAELRSTRPSPPVHADVEPDMMVVADEHLMRIVLANLIGNSWKYASRVVHPRVRVGQTVRDGEIAYFVQDNGCGFDMRFVGKLFQPFQRLHTADEYEGTGVGLATVARIVRRHGGRVNAVGEPGTGATFEFTIGEAEPA